MECLACADRAFFWLSNACLRLGSSDTICHIQGAKEERANIGKVSQRTSFEKKILDFFYHLFLKGCIIMPKRFLNFEFFLFFKKVVLNFMKFGISDLNFL